MWSSLFSKIIYFEVVNLHKEISSQNIFLKKVVAKLPMLGSYKHTDNHVITCNLKQLLPISIKI